MYYYKFHIGDYRAATGHLSPTEHYIYRSLMDIYYLDEKPIKDDVQLVLRLLRLGKECEAELSNVLSDFFFKEKDVWKHKRIEIEIEKYADNTSKNRRNGKGGGRPKKPSGLPVGTQTEPTGNLNHKPLTKNQEPLPVPSKGKLSVVGREGEPEKFAAGGEPW
jgi:uncharacterized protein YdaU (DUF1376 family)